jgi:hypothetical protein
MGPTLEPGLIWGWFKQRRFRVTPSQGKTAIPDQDCYHAAARTQSWFSPKRFALLHLMEARRPRLRSRALVKSRTVDGTPWHSLASILFLPRRPERRNTQRSRAQAGARHAPARRPRVAHDPVPGWSATVPAISSPNRNFHRFTGLLLQNLLQAATTWIFPACHAGSRRFRKTPGKVRNYAGSFKAALRLSDLINWLRHVAAQLNPVFTSTPSNGSGREVGCRETGILCARLEPANVKLPSPDLACAVHNVLRNALLGPSAELAV